ncbi:MAG: hypothetical protein ACLVC1_12425 [Mediterraneibacter gnavus]
MKVKEHELSRLAYRSQKRCHRYDHVPEMAGHIGGDMSVMETLVDPVF